MTAILTKFKKYLLGRLDSVTAWIGLLGFIFEPILHRDPSTLFLVCFALLIVLPQQQFTSMFGGLTKGIRDLDSGTDA